MPDSEFIKIRDVARRLGVNRMTVLRWIKAGQFEGAIQPVAGGDWLIPAGAVDEMIQRSNTVRQKATA